MQEQTIALLPTVSFSPHLCVCVCVCVWVYVCAQVCSRVCVPTPSSGAASFSKPLGRPDSQLGECQGRQRAEQTHPFLLTREQRGLAPCVHLGACHGCICVRKTFFFWQHLLFQCYYVVLGVKRWSQFCLI